MCRALYLRFFFLVGAVFLIIGCKKDLPYTEFPEIPLVNGNINLKLISNDIIYHTSPYNAFTDLTMIDGVFYVVFREAVRHEYDSLSSIVVLRSRDFRRWGLVTKVRGEKQDVRDPKFLKFRGVNYINFNEVIFSREVKNRFINNSYSVGENFTSIKRDNSVVARDLWFWSAIEHQGTLFRSAYSNINNVFRLYRSDSASREGIGCDLDIPNNPSEASLIVHKGKLYSGIRTLYKGLLTTASLDDVCKPEIVQLPIFQMGGPLVKTLNDSTLIIGARELINGSFSGDGVKTSIFSYDINKKTISKLIELASSTDTGYPGMLVAADTLYVSYYDFHVPTGKAVIRTASLLIQ